MILFNSILKLLRNKKFADVDTDSRQQVLLLNFILIASAITNLIFSAAHILFFEQAVGYVLFSFFIVFALLFILFNTNLNYKLYSTLAIIFLTVLFILISLVGAGNKTGIMWGLTYPLIVAFTTKSKHFNTWTLGFLLVTLIVFFVPNNFDFWAKYSSDIILRYLSAYFLSYALIRFYLILRQQTINKNEKELIETKHKLLKKDKFISSLSYDIRTPLNNIAGIINHEKKSVSKDVIEEIELSISNLASILNKIPENTEKHILNLTGEKTSFNINDIIKKIIHLFKTDKYSKLRFNFYLSENIPENVFGDRINFMQLIISTVDFFFNSSNKNSLKIDIVSQETQDNTVLIKISCKTENLIFPKNLSTENFIRDIKELKIINKTAQALNGNLEIIKDENNITTLFRLNFEELPKKTDTVPDSESIIERKSYPHTKIRLKDANVLLVEDDVINSKVMTLNIQKLVNKIIIAENGKEALEKFSETKVDIILMDIRMPLMDGFKTTEKIREAEIGTGSYVPIIAVTANASSEVKKHCFEVGMNDYTTKPTNYKLLLKKMKKLLEE